MSSGFLRDVLTWFAAFAAFLAAGGVVMKSPVGKWVAWVYKQLIGQPGTDWFERNVDRVFTPHVTALRAENTQQHAEGAARLSAAEGRLGKAIRDLDERNTADHVVMKTGIAEAQASIAAAQAPFAAHSVVATTERANLSQQITDQGGQNNGQTVDA